MAFSHSLVVQQDYPYMRDTFLNLRSRSLLLDVKLTGSPSDPLMKEETPNVFLAHSILLMSSSPVLAEKVIEGLSRGGGPNRPIDVILDGAKTKHVGSIVEFIYEGQVQIAKEDLEEFLVLATKLQIVGLKQIGGCDEDQSGPSRKIMLPYHEDDEKKKKKQKLSVKDEPEELQQEEEEEEEEGGDDEGDWNAPVCKSEPDSKRKEKMTVDKLMRDEVVQSKDGSFTCLLCQKVIKHKHHMRVHVRNKHTKSDKIFACPVCYMMFSQRSVIYAHVLNNHRAIKGVNLDKHIVGKQ